MDAAPVNNSTAVVSLWTAGYYTMDPTAPAFSCTSNHIPSNCQQACRDTLQISSFNDTAYSGTFASNVAMPAGCVNFTCDQWTGVKDGATATFSYSAAGMATGSSAGTGTVTATNNADGTTSKITLVSSYTGADGGDFSCTWVMVYNGATQPVGDHFALTGRKDYSGYYNSSLPSCSSGYEPGECDTSLKSNVYVNDTNGVLNISMTPASAMADCNAFWFVVPDYPLVTTDTGNGEYSLDPNNRGFTYKKTYPANGVSCAWNLTWVSANTPSGFVPVPPQNSVPPQGSSSTVSNPSSTATPGNQGTNGGAPAASSGPSMRLIIGIVAGAIVLLAIVGAVVGILFRKSRKASSSKMGGSSDSYSTMQMGNNDMNGPEFPGKNMTGPSSLSHPSDPVPYTEQPTFLPPTSAFAPQQSSSSSWSNFGSSRTGTVRQPQMERPISMAPPYSETPYTNGPPPPQPQDDEHAQPMATYHPMNDAIDARRPQRGTGTAMSRRIQSPASSISRPPQRNDTMSTDTRSGDGGTMDRLESRGTLSAPPRRAVPRGGTVGGGSVAGLDVGRVEEWTAREVGAWAVTAGVSSDGVKALYDRGIDGPTLKTLDDEKVLKSGYGLSVPDRLALVDAIKTLRRANLGGNVGGSHGRYDSYGEEPAPGYY